MLHINNNNILVIGVWTDGYLDDRQVKDLSGLSNLRVVSILSDDVRGQGIVGHLLPLPRLQQLDHLQAQVTVVWCQSDSMVSTSGVRLATLT